MGGWVPTYSLTDCKASQTRSSPLVALSSSLAGLDACSPGWIPQSGSTVKRWLLYKVGSMQGVLGQLRAQHATRKVLGR